MKIIKADEVATMLATTPSHIYALARQNKIPYVRVGRLVRFEEAQIFAWMVEQRN
ncbi:Helix-turn-helix domain protein [compost metagenome]